MQDHKYELGINDLKIIVDLCKLMNKAINYEPLLEQIMIYCTAAMNVEGASILLYDSKIDKLIFYLTTGHSSEKLKKILLNPDEGIAGWVFNNNKSYVCNDLSREPRFCSRVDESTEFKTKSIIAVPLVSEDKIIGVFELVNKKSDDSFSERDLVLCEGIAAEVALAIERTCLVQENIKNSRLVAIGEAIAGLSHHIKNILTGLEGGATVIKASIGDKKYSNVEKMWPIIENGIQRMSSFTRDMLDMSKDRKPNYTLEDINKILNEVVKLYEDKAKSKNIDFELSMDTSIPKFYFDAYGIYKCVLNLVSNSFDACANSLDSKIRIRSKNLNEKNIIIEVIDNGCGMSKEVMDKIMMSKFFSTKGSMGTGFGLHVVQKIVTEHNGRLDIKSEVNKGSTFGVILPLVHND